MDLPERLERLAAATADLVQPGMVIGLGTGSTADAVTRELGRRVAAGLRFSGVPTSRRTESLARELGISLTTLDEHELLDFGFDGVDELDPALNAIKGRGGALLREKLVASACLDYVFVATTEKSVAVLGERTPLPVEIVRFGWKQTASRLSQLGIAPSLRHSGGEAETAFTTDNGGLVLDCETGPLADPFHVASAIKGISGVVDHGLFLDMAQSALQVDPEERRLATRCLFQLSWSRSMELPCCGWRYDVNSLVGEALRECMLDSAGSGGQAEVANSAAIMGSPGARARDAH